MRILITGAGGFIGSHLAKRLTADGHQVFGVDVKRNTFWPEVEFNSFFWVFGQGDLRDAQTMQKLLACGGIDRVYHLGADMGGIGFIERYKAQIVYNNTLIDMNVLELAYKFAVGRLLYASSACVYPGLLQERATGYRLSEGDAYPADAEDGYGWQKLYTERACRHYREDYGLDTRIVRLHNVFGPYGAWDGGREKAPAAICRKVAAPGNDITIWGDGKQMRSFLYVDDCVEGLIRLMESSYTEPLNIGQDRAVTIDQLVSMVETIAGKKMVRKYDLSAAQGVRGRNADIRRAQEVLGWAPKVSLEDGLARTFGFVAAQMDRKRR